MANNGGMQVAEVDAATSKQNKEGKGWSMEPMTILEVVVMTPIVLVTVGVFLIPIILYALPPPPPPGNPPEVSS